MIAVSQLLRRPTHRFCSKTTVSVLSRLDLQILVGTYSCCPSPTNLVRTFYNIVVAQHLRCIFVRSIFAQTGRLKVSHDNFP